jgi:hypothetical protein
MRHEITKFNILELVIPGWGVFLNQDIERGGQATYLFNKLCWFRTNENMTIVIKKESVNFHNSPLFFQAQIRHLVIALWACRIGSEQNARDFQMAVVAVVNWLSRAHE